jgi:hypothetical protein
MPRRRIFILLLGCLCLPFAIWFGRFDSLEICTTCGQMQYLSEFQIPLTRLTYFTTRRPSATPFSIALNRAKIVNTTHTHQWLFASGGGNGILCAIGDGRHLLTAVTSPDVATFLQATATYRGQPAAQAWINTLLDPKQSFEASSAIQCATVPTAGFPTKAAYDRWLQAQPVQLETWHKPGP